MQGMMTKKLVNSIIKKRQTPPPPWEYRRQLQGARKKKGFTNRKARDSLKLLGIELKMTKQLVLKLITTPPLCNSSGSSVIVLAVV